MKRSCIVLLLVAAQLLLVFCSCTADGGDVVMKLGNTNIRYEEFRYFYLNTKEDAEANGSSGSLLDKVSYNIKNAYIYETVAKKYHVSLSKDDMDAIRDQIEEMKSRFADESEYYGEMSKSYMTDYTFRRVLEVQTLRTRLFEKLTDDLTGEIDTDPVTVKEYIKNNFYRATQVLILYGDDGDAALRLAREVLEKARSGEDFQSLVDEYGEDPALHSNANGYYAAAGELLTELENAALALSPGEISEIVSSPLGYHIIKRMDQDEEYIKLHYDEMLYKYENRVFNEICEKCRDETELKYTDRYYALDLDSIK